MQYVPDVALIRSSCEAVRYDEDGRLILTLCLSLDILPLRSLSERVGVVDKVEAYGPAVVGPEECARVGDFVDEGEVADG